MTIRPRITVLVCSLALVALLPLAAAAQTPITTIVNPGFETGTPSQPVSAGWSTISGEGPMYIVDSTIVPLLESIDPSTPYEGLQYLTGNRNAGGDPPGAGVGVIQDVDLSPWATDIDMGGRGMSLSFAYNDSDGADFGIVQFSFLDGGGSPVGDQYSFNTDTAPTSGGSWATQSLLGSVPALARTLRLELTAPNAGGTLRNISYDAISASLLPEAPVTPISDRVNGNLIQFNSHGAWSWYMDERAIVDPTNEHVLIGSTVAQGGGITTGRPGGAVDVVDFNPATGERNLTQLSDIQSDDHNAPGLLILPDGRYLAMYSNHGNSGGLGDEFTRWRRGNIPNDSSSWTSEQLFNWHDEVPGADTAPGIAPGNVSYHNLFYLSAEDQVYDISRSYGQLSINGDTQNMPNIARYDMDTNTIEWAGQVLESEAQGYSAYPKYVSNGVDRIYFISTESHPREYNNSIFAGYIEDGQTFDMDGNVIDDDLFDNGTVEGGSGFVSDVIDYSPVQQADTPEGTGYNHLWTADLALGADGNPVALYTSRFENDTTDHRLHYARYDGSTWHTYEVAHMAERLYGPEEDYTGVGAVVPGDADTIYISTPVDPRDASGNTVTSAHEIYKGVTADGGASWTWSAITEASSVDNLRPIVPDPHGGDTTVIWFRGDYNTAQSIDAAVVGIVERNDETVGLVNYVDANTGNTTRSNGAAIGATGPNSSVGATDNNWHERTGFGNEGSVFTANESGSENAPTLRTTLSGLGDGLYDIFAYFWSDNDEDWRLTAGFDTGNMVEFRHHGSQHAAEDQFITIDTVSANDNDLLLYRAYVGRTEVLGGSDIDVFINDWSTSNDANRTWYDGVGYALISDVAPLLIGDYNGDDIVEAADYTVWRDAMEAGAMTLLNRDPANIGLVDEDDYASWRVNFGNTPEPGGGSAAGTAVPEPSSLCLGLLFLLCLLGARSFPQRSE